MENLNHHSPRQTKDCEASSTSMSETENSGTEMSGSLRESFEYVYSIDNPENDANTEFPIFPSNRFCGVDIMSIVMKRRLGGDSGAPGKSRPAKKPRIAVVSDEGYDETDSLTGNQDGNFVNQSDDCAEIFVKRPVNNSKVIKPRNNVELFEDPSENDIKTVVDHSNNRAKEIVSHSENNLEDTEKVYQYEILPDLDSSGINSDDKNCSAINSDKKKEIKPRIVEFIDSESNSSSAFILSNFQSLNSNSDSENSRKDNGGAFKAKDNDIDRFGQAFNGEDESKELQSNCNAPARSELPERFQDAFHAEERSESNSGFEEEFCKLEGSKTSRSSVLSGADIKIFETGCHTTLSSFHPEDAVEKQNEISNIDVGDEALVKRAKCELATSVKAPTSSVHSEKDVGNPISSDDTKKSRKQNKPRRLAKQVCTSVEVETKDENDSVSDPELKVKSEKSRKQYKPQRIVQDVPVGEAKDDSSNNKVGVDENLKEVKSIVKVEEKVDEDEEETYYSCGGIQVDQKKVKRNKANSKSELHIDSELYVYGNPSHLTPKTVDLNSLEQGGSPSSLEQGGSPSSWQNNVLSSFPDTLLQSSSSSSVGDSHASETVGTHLEENLEIVRRLREIRFNRYRKISISEKKEIAGYAKISGVSSAAAHFGVSKSAVSMWTRMDFSDIEDDFGKRKKNCMKGNEKFEILVNKVKVEKMNKFKGLTKQDKFEVSRYAKLVGVREMARCLGIALGTVSGWMRQFPYNLKPTNTDADNSFQSASECADTMSDDQVHSGKELKKVTPHEKSSVEDCKTMYDSSDFSKSNKKVPKQKKKIDIKTEDTQDEEYGVATCTFAELNNSIKSEVIEDNSINTEHDSSKTENTSFSSNIKSLGKELHVKQEANIIAEINTYKGDPDIGENEVDETKIKDQHAVETNPETNKDLHESETDTGKCSNRKAKKGKKVKQASNDEENSSQHSDTGMGELKKDEVDELIAETLVIPDPEQCFSDIKAMIVGSPLENDAFFENLFRRVINCRVDKYKSLKASEKLEVVRYAKRNGVRRIAKILGLATGTLSGWNTKYQAHLGLTMETSMDSMNDSVTGYDANISSMSTDLDSISVSNSQNVLNASLISENFGNFSVSNTMSPSMMAANTSSSQSTSLLDNEEKSEVTAIKFLFKEQYPVLLQKIEIARKIKFRNITPNEKIEIVKCAKLVGIRPTARVLNMPIGTLSGWITKYSNDLHPVYHVDGEETMDVRPLHLNQQFPLPGLLNTSFPNQNESMINIAMLNRSPSLSSPSWPNKRSGDFRLNAGYDENMVDMSKYTKLLNTFGSGRPEMAGKFSDSSANNFGNDEMVTVSRSKNVYQDPEAEESVASKGSIVKGNNQTKDSESEASADSGSGTSVGSSTTSRNRQPELEGANFDVEAKMMAQQYLHSAYQQLGLVPQELK